MIGYLFFILAHLYASHDNSHKRIRWSAEWRMVSVCKKRWFQCACIHISKTKMKNNHVICSLKLKLTAVYIIYTVKCFYFYITYSKTLLFNSDRSLVNLRGKEKWIVTIDICICIYIEWLFTLRNGEVNVLNNMFPLMSFLKFFFLHLYINSSTKWR